MNSKNQQKKKEIDWMITLVPLALIVALCIVFFFAPEQSNQVLGQIRFLFGDTFGTYYLVIGLGIFFLSLFLAGSKYGNIVLGKPDEKPKYSFFAWGCMMFTCGLAADILFYSFSEWILYATDPHIAELWQHSGLGRRISTVSLELYPVGILSGTGCCVWLYASCKKTKPSEIQRGVPSDSGKTDRWNWRPSD